MEESEERWLQGCHKGRSRTISGECSPRLQKNSLGWKSARRFIRVHPKGRAAMSIDSGRAGYYITNGKAVAVTWAKTGENTPTVFFDAMTGKPIEINTGKTYIALVPSDSFANIVIQ